jgi:hypothetical protein
MTTMSPETRRTEAEALPALDHPADVGEEVRTEAPPPMAEELNDLVRRSSSGRLPDGLIIALALRSGLGRVG